MQSFGVDDASNANPVMLGVGRIERTITFEPISLEQVREFSEDFALMFEWFDAVGYDADIAVQEVGYGIRLTRFHEWAGRRIWAEAAVWVTELGSVC